MKLQLACGMGPQDTAHFLTYLDIPKMQSFCNQQLTQIENLIGKCLMEVSEQSIQDLLELITKET